MSVVQSEHACFQFKASFLPSTILQIKQDDLMAFEHQLQATIRSAPNFFVGLPIVIDLENISSFNPLNLLKIKELLLAQGMIPLGVRGGTGEQQQAALQIGLSVLPPTKITPVTTETKTVPKNSMAKMIHTPVRSGMQIYAKEADLIVTAPVSPGAELFADGSIHVYGPLRGRVLAGVQGNKAARIFCRTIEAELLSIAGHYLTRDDIQTFSHPTNMIQVYLEDTQLHMSVIN